MHPLKRQPGKPHPRGCQPRGRGARGSQRLRVAGGVKSAQRTLGCLQTAQGTRVTLSASWAHSRGPCPKQTAWTVLRRCRGLSPFAFEASAAPALPYPSSSSKGPRTPRGFCAALTMAALFCHRGEVPRAPRLWPLLFPPGAAREALSGPPSSLGLPPGPHHAPSALHGACRLGPAARHPLPRASCRPPAPPDPPTRAQHCPTQAFCRVPSSPRMTPLSPRGPPPPHGWPLPMQGPHFPCVGSPPSPCGVPVLSRLLEGR